MFAATGFLVLTSVKNILILSADPSTSISTPFEVLRMNPVNPRSFANRYIKGRNPTPWTTPLIMTFLLSRIKVFYYIITDLFYPITGFSRYNNDPDFWVLFFQLRNCFLEIEISIGQQIDFVYYHNLCKME